MKLSIIIPVYDEEKTILKVIQKILSLDIPGIEKEIIVVNDGSTDNTSNLLKNYSKKSPIAVINHSENKGKGSAIISGIKQSRGEYVLIQDADLEYNPYYIPVLLGKVDKNKKNVIYGTRLNRFPNFLKDESTPLFFLHYLGNRLLSLLTSVLYVQWITDMETGYKLIPKKILEDINLSAQGFDFEPEITAKLLKAGCRIQEVSISTNPRSYNEGKKLNTLRDGIIALWTIIKYRFVN